MTTSGPPAFATTDVENRGVSVRAEWVDGPPSAPRLDGSDLSGQVRCGLAVLADLGRVPLGVLMPGAQEYRPQHSVRVSATRDSLTLTFASGARPQRLAFRPGSAASYLKRVGQLRVAAGLAPLDSRFARRVLARAGFTLDGDMSPWVEPQFPSAFRAVHGTCTGSGDGACQHVFFFYGNRYLGTDAQDTHSGVYVAWQSRDVIALAYPIWRPQDSMCCPSGGVRVVRFEWNGSRVVPLGPIPS